MAKYFKTGFNRGVKMKKLFSTKWKSSKNPRKQRKYVVNAPLHIKHKFLGAHLSKELMTKYKIRSLPLRKEDEVIIKRGSFKGVKGKIEKVLLRRTRVHIAGAQISKRDGNKVFYPIHPSNVIITELNLKDKERVKVIERRSKK